MVPGAGLEPARPFERGILNPLCLPISPPGQTTLCFNHVINGGGSRSRTEVDGFAIRCMATLPTRLTLTSVNGYYTVLFGAGNETRTRDLDLGKVALYQLSYARFLSGLRRNTRRILLSLINPSTSNFNFINRLLNF